MLACLLAYPSNWCDTGKKHGFDNVFSLFEGEGSKAMMTPSMPAGGPCDEVETQGHLQRLEDHAYDSERIYACVCMWDSGC